MALIELNNVNSGENFTGIKGLRANSLIIFLAGLVIFISAIFVFLMIVKSVYGNYDVAEILPTQENIFYQAEDEKTALLYSIYTENMNDDGNTWIQDNLNTWMNFLRQYNISYDILTDVDIEEGKHFDYNILVLAGAKSLSDREMSQIKRYIDNGGSIFATGGVGTYSDEGKWKSWQFFNEIFGMKFTREISPKIESSKVHTLRGNLPITAGIPTGYALNIATWDRPIYTEILEPRTEQVSYWFDYRKEKGLVGEKIKKSAGITTGKYGEGRFIWFGFEINSVIGGQQDHIYFGRLFQNCINWLYYKPTALVKDWPDSYNAAAIFLPTFEQNFDNIGSIVKSLDKNNYPADFLIDSKLALHDSSNTKILNRYGSIVPIIRLNVNDQDESLDQLYIDKHLKLSESIHSSLSKLLNNSVNGVASSPGNDIQTEAKIYSKNHFKFILTDSLLDRSVPKKFVFDENEIFIISNTGRDDKIVINEFGLNNPDFQKYTYIEDIDRILLEGGLYVIKFHNNLQLGISNFSIVEDLVEYIRSKKIWFTSVNNIVNWWQKRSGIELRYDTRSKRRISVEVSNHELETISDFTVQIFPNKLIKNIEISAEMIHTPIPKFEFDNKSNILFLFVDNLKPDESRTYLIDFENVQLASIQNNWN